MKVFEIHYRTWLRRFVLAFCCAVLMACFGVRGSVDCMCAGAVIASGLFLWALYNAGRLPVGEVRDDKDLSQSLIVLRVCAMQALWVDHLMLDLFPLVGWGILGVAFGAHSIRLWGSVVLDVSLLALVCQIFSIVYQTFIGNLIADVREDMVQRMNRE